MGFLPWLLVPAVFATLACLAFFPVPPLAGDRLLGCACADPVDQSWFLGWTGFAAAHHLNPFFTTYLGYPAGTNVLANISMPGLGLLLAPVSLTLGPVVAFNLGMRLAFAVSATAMFAVLRWWRLSWPAAALGGLLYGFSPYLVGQALGHLHMAFVPIPPLFLFVLERGLSGRWKARSGGLLLGLLAVVQFFIAVEVVTSLLVLTAVILAAVWLVRRGEAWAARGRVVAILAWMGAVMAVGLCYPAWFLLAGPGAVPSPLQPIWVLDNYRADLLSVVMPTNLERLGPAAWKVIATSYAAGDRSENGEYLGLPMVVALVAVAVACWRDLRVRVVALVLMAVFVLTLGTRLNVGGTVTAVRLPFEVISHLPVLDNQIPLRYSVYLQLLAAALVAYGLHAYWGRIRERARRAATPARARAVKWGGAGAAAVAVGLVLAPLVPALPYQSPPLNVSPFFTSGKVNSLPQGTVVLAYPYPAPREDYAMLWQELSGWRFRLLGGYAYHRGPDHSADLSPSRLPPTMVQETLEDSFSGAGSDGLPPGTTVAEVARQVVVFCRRYRVGAIFAADLGRHPKLVMDVVDRALGYRGYAYHGLRVWTTAGRL